MKVLLINPPYDIERYMGKLSKMGFVFQPFGLAYIASYLRMKGIEVSIFDSQVESHPILERVREYSPDIIGITSVTALVHSTIELARLLKQDFPDIKIVVGGIHPTIRPQDFLAEPAIDFVACGEGEVTMYELVTTLESGGDPAMVPGIRCIRDGQETVAQPRQLHKNLDDFPPPALDLLPFNKYRVSPDVKTGDRVGVMFTSRGCPFDCIFCSNRLLTKKTYRMHSIERVCSEVQQMIDSYGVNQIFVMDDNFAANKKRAKELCRAFIERGFHRKVSWWSEARVDCVDEELLDLMGKANCRIISYGLESGNQRLLDLIKKNITLEQVERTIRWTQKAGIDIRATFMIGLPTETREESLNTIRFAKKLGIDQIRFSLATPFPGTELWDIAQAEGRLNFTDWRQFSMMAGYVSGGPVYTPAGRTAGELARLQRHANLTFFLRPKVIWVYLKRMNNWNSIKDISLGAIRFAYASLFPGR